MMNLVESIWSLSSANYSLLYNQISVFLAFLHFFWTIKRQAYEEKIKRKILYSDKGSHSLSQIQMATKSSYRSGMSHTVWLYECINIASCISVFNGNICIINGHSYYFDIEEKTRVYKCINWIRLMYRPGITCWNVCCPNTKVI